MKNLEAHRFRIAKSIVFQELSNQFIYGLRQLEELERQLDRNPNLGDAKVLMRMLRKEIQAHNAKNRTDTTRINNLDYKGVKTYQSKLFKKYLKVSITKIDQAIRDNPNLEAYEVFNKCFEKV